MLNHTHLPALREARRIIENGRIKYICFALTEAADRATHLTPACHEIREFIEQGLERRHLLSTWILDELFPAWQSPDVPEPYRSGWHSEDGVFTLCRLAWLDRMILDIEGTPFEEPQ